MYDNLGGNPVIPAADLLDMQSPANRSGVGNARRGSVPQVIGKAPGLVAWRDAGNGDLSMVFALGANPSDGWREADGSATRTPNNLSTLATVDGDHATYDPVTGVLEALTVDQDTEAVATAMSAGKYLISGLYAANGTLDPKAYSAVKVTVTTSVSGSTESYILDKNVVSGPTLDDAVAWSVVVTLPVAEDITISAQVVDEAGDLVATGEVIFTLNPMQSV